MKQYLYDMHVHTVETSFCGRVSGKELVHLYKAAGYDGVVITDHYYDGFFEALPPMPWNEKIDAFLDGYSAALAEGIKEGLHVLMGMEIRFTESFNDYLVYGVHRDLLIAYPELYKLGLKDFYSFAQAHGLVVFQAHPFRPGCSPADPALLHGAEVYNGNSRHDSSNKSAIEFAQRHHLKEIAGSDFHQVEDVAAAGIFLPYQPEDSVDLSSWLRNESCWELKTMALQQ